MFYFILLFVFYNVSCFYCEALSECVLIIKFVIMRLHMGHRGDMMVMHARKLE